MTFGHLGRCALLGWALWGCGSSGDVHLFPTSRPSELPPTLRDPKLFPYAATSIWNTPLGDSAVLVPVALHPATFGIRSEAVAILLETSFPAVAVQHSDAGWSGADRCPAAAPLHFAACAPDDFLVVEGPGKSGVPIVAVQADGRSLKQGLPFARCAAGTPGTIAFEEPAGDLFGDGLRGANGGSGLSALGGVLRLGELGPDAPAPRHALAIHLSGEENLNRSATPDECFRWPASRGDEGCVDRYGGAETALRMGSLLALPRDHEPALRTKAAEKLAWTLENYGAYVVNDAGSSSYAFNVELSPTGWFDDDFASTWGFAFQTADTTSDWAGDVQALFGALAVVDDNGPATPGGAGARLQPASAALEP